MLAVLNALIPVAIAAVAVVLALGIWQLFKGGNPNRSNRLMRWRILLQFVAVLLIAAAAFIMSRGNG
jgi:membrane protease YdiL (CAAX protease family)